MSFDQKPSLTNPTLKRKRPRTHTITVQKKKRVLYTETQIDSTLESNDLNDANDSNAKLAIPQSWDIFIPRRPKRKLEQLNDLSEDNAVFNSRKKQRQLLSSPLLQDHIELSDDFHNKKPNKIDKDEADVFANKQDKANRKTEIADIQETPNEQQLHEESKQPQNESDAVIQAQVDPQPQPTPSVVQTPPPPHPSDDRMHDSPDDTSLLVDINTPKSQPPPPQFDASFKFGETKMDFNFNSPGTDKGPTKDVAFHFGATKVEAQSENKPFVFGGAPQSTFKAAPANAPQSTFEFKAAPVNAPPPSQFTFQATQQQQPFPAFQPPPLEQNYSDMQLDVAPTQPLFQTPTPQTPFVQQQQQQLFNTTPTQADAANIFGVTQKASHLGVARPRRVRKM